MIIRNIKKIYEKKIETVSDCIKELEEQFANITKLPFLEREYHRVQSKLENISEVLNHKQLELEDKQKELLCIQNEISFLKINIKDLELLKEETIKKISKLNKDIALSKDISQEDRIMKEDKNVNAEKTEKEIAELEKRIEDDLIELEGIRVSLSAYDIALYKLPDEVERTPEEEEEMLKERALLLDKYAELRPRIRKMQMELTYLKSERK